MNCVYIGVYVKVLIRFLPFPRIFLYVGGLKTEASRRFTAAYYWTTLDKFDNSDNK